MRGLSGAQTAVTRGAGMRLALMGAGLSLTLALLLPLVVSHPAQGVVLPMAASTLDTTRTADANNSIGSTLAAAAQPQAEQGNSNVRSKADPRGHELSRAEAVSLVQRRYRARVVRTQLSHNPAGRPVYEFRLLSGGGKVWTVRIDAYSGAELP
jgi:uncharacterized membrane protein YkoI